MCPSKCCFWLCKWRCKVNWCMITQAQDLSLNEDLTNFASSPRGEGRLYNPYEGLSNAVDPRVLRSVYKLPSQPEFLFSEQATVHRRSWSENLTYYTGTGYATGEASLL